MTLEERKQAARNRALAMPKDEHVVYWSDDLWPVCIKCGKVRPAAGWQRACRGRVAVALRQEETR